jgi:WD40 repeat protein
VAGQVLLWDLADPRRVITLTGSQLVAVGAARSADGRRVAALDGGGNLRAWEMPSRRELFARKAHTAAGSVAIDPAGKLLASGGGVHGQSGELKVWEVSTGELRLDLPGHGSVVNNLAFSPDGTRLASSSIDGLLRLQDTRSGAILWAHQGAAPMGLEFSPDGAALACGDWDGLVTIRETDSGREVRSLRGHTKTVQGVAFHPDGRRLASGSVDNTVRLWDLSSGQEALVLKSEKPLVAFSPDGHTLFATGNGPQVRLWRDTAGPEAP